MLVATLLSPFVFSNLRVPLRPYISISDASGTGGAAGESKEFKCSVVVKHKAILEGAILASNKLPVCVQLKML